MNARGPGARAGIPPLARVPLLVLGFAGLVAGIGAGLARLGWMMPDFAATAATLHGPLMICGFFGVVISLERAVAIGRRWAYLGPLLAGIGGIALIEGSTAAGGWLLVAGSVVLLVASVDIFRRQRAVFTFTLALGAACWTVGNALWLAGLPPNVTALWWLAFLILTIAAERLELSRFLPPSPAAHRMFVAVLLALVAGLAGAGAAWGPPAFGGGLLALAGWLIKQDIARRTIRSKGLTRYIAACLLSGYVWLAAGGGVILVAGGLAPGSAANDAAIHAIAIGFVFSMIFGHAPIILPAVLRAKMPYRATFYLPLALLHGSLLVRIAGDALGGHDLVRIGGLLNALAIAAFILNSATAVAMGKRRDTGGR